jgi:hypothetical protein
MSNLVKQQLAVNEIQIMAKNFAESGMFSDSKSMVQAFVKIQAGQEIGLPPFASMSGIHIIQGKPTLGAGVIASAIKGSGKYNYRVIEMSEKLCSIDFFEGKEKIGNSEFTIEDAKKAGTKNIDKFPKNMLFARAISNGVKWFCPDVFAGPVYVPEEMEHLTVDVIHEEVKPISIILPEPTEKQFSMIADKILNGEDFETVVSNAQKHFTINEGKLEILRNNVK